MIIYFIMTKLDFPKPNIYRNPISESCVWCGDFLVNTAQRIGVQARKSNIRAFQTNSPGTSPLPSMGTSSQGIAEIHQDSQGIASTSSQNFSTSNSQNQFSQRKEIASHPLKYKLSPCGNAVRKNATILTNPEFPAFTIPNFYFNNLLMTAFFYFLFYISPLSFYLNSGGVLVLAAFTGIAIHYFAALAFPLNPIASFSLVLVLFAQVAFFLANVTNSPLFYIYIFATGTGITNILTDSIAEGVASVIQQVGDAVVSQVLTSVPSYGDQVALTLTVLAALFPQSLILLYPLAVLLQSLKRLKELNEANRNNPN